jgi:hypothetical protein
VYLSSSIVKLISTCDTSTYDNDDDDDDYLYKNYKERVSQNLYSINFHTDQPKRHKYKKNINDNKE